jgi:hypothetical protein
MAPRWPLVLPRIYSKERPVSEDARYGAGGGGGGFGGLGGGGFGGLDGNPRRAARHPAGRHPRA